LEPNYGHYQLNSQIVSTSLGRLVLDRWYDEAGANGLDIWNIDSNERLVASSVDDHENGYIATVDIGGNTAPIAANPLPEGPGDCFETVVTSDSDIEMWPHTQAVLDLCSTGGGPAHDVVAILTEGSRLTIFDDGAGGARVFYEPPFGDDPFTDDNGTSANEDALRVYEAAMARSPDTLFLRAQLGVPALRTCDANDIPTWTLTR
jgi:hypothetical protein